MRRVLHRLLAGSAATLLALAVAAVPAQAAAPDLALHFPDISVAADSAGKVGALMAWVEVPDRTDGAPLQINRLWVSVDAAGLAGVATVTVIDDLELTGGQSCGRTGTVTTCTLTGPIVLEAGGTNLIPLLGVQVSAERAAATGATGKMAFTAQADGGPVVRHTSTVGIGEGVDLAAVAAKKVTIAPGATGSADLRVANEGTRPVTGVVLVLLGWDESLIDGAGFGNCTYGVLTVCTFDDVLAPGRTYGLSTPVRLRMPADAAAGSSAGAIGSWYTPADFKELLSLLPGTTGEQVLGRPGTGPRVHLASAASARESSRAASSQVDTDPENNVLISEVVVGGGREPDLAAIGATVAGAPGDEVDVRVGFVNDGPGALYHSSFDNTGAATHVTVPPGLRAVEVDEGCFPMSDPETGDLDDPDGDLSGASDYLCVPEAEKTGPKATVLFDFTFQVRDRASGDAGRVTINDDTFVPMESLDRDAANDAARITVDLATGGTAGGLPVTGASAVLAATGAAVLLLAGGLVLLLARRRRLRFTA